MRKTNVFIFHRAVVRTRQLSIIIFYPCWIPPGFFTTGHMKSIIIFIALMIVAQARAQSVSRDRAQALYANGVTLLANNKIFEAGAEFQKAIELNPEHRDALYQMAMVNERLGDSAGAIGLLLKSMKLNDRRASRELVQRYGFKLSYADTMQNIDPAVRDKYRTLTTPSVLSFQDLSKQLIAATPNKREQLQLFLLWTFDHMNADSVRFFQGGAPFSNDEAFARRTGLCDEYSNLMNDFCKQAGIVNYKVPGYVKYPAFKAGDSFTEVNHAWNAVYIDSSWLLCDLFWSTVALEADDGSEPRFIRRLEPIYFLSIPSDFVNQHLPADPVFQFSDYPIAFRSFTGKVQGIDGSEPRMSYLNYKDSLKTFSAMGEPERGLKVAHHSYAYNPDNANDLIVTSYNYAVDVLSDPSSKRKEWITARKSLSLSMTIIDKSPNGEIRALKGSCKTAMSMLDRRLAAK